MTTHALPAGVAHADWGVAPRKRWVAAATLDDSGAYLADAPRTVRLTGPIRERMSLPASMPGAALLGFDFPIGLPAAYAAATGITSFCSALLEFGSGQWSEFFEVAVGRGDISLRRPFYPVSCPTKGLRKQADLTNALGLSMKHLLRRCERATATRRAACSLFWTLGGNQVGKGALSGWREILQPALRSEGSRLVIWPFDGELGELIAGNADVVAETYPAEFYGHLGVRLDSQLRGGKRSQTARQANGPILIEWSRRHGIRLTESLRSALMGGFGPGGDGEDPFDAVIGLLGMLNVVLGGRPTGEPSDPAVRQLEGWILGQEFADADLLPPPDAGRK